MSEGLYARAAREFFERQQAARRERQRLARSGAEEPEAESRPDSEPEAMSTAEPSNLPDERPVGPPATTQISPSRSAPPSERSPERSPYVLRVLAGDEPGNWFALTLGSMSIGRRPGSDILLHDPLVSHAHAVIETTPHRVTVRDDNSTNGTQVNGVEISQPTDLRPGDTVSMGDVLMLLERAGDEA